EYLGTTKEEGADGRNHVLVGKHHVVIRNTTRHACQTGEVHGEEGQFEADRRQPEMGFTHDLAVRLAAPLGQPVVNTGSDREDGAGYQYIVEVSYHKVGVVILEVRRGNGQHQAREAADGKQNYEGDGEEHGCFKGHGAFEHGGCPVEH